MKGHLELDTGHAEDLLAKLAKKLAGLPEAQRIEVEADLNCLRDILQDQKHRAEHQQNGGAGLSESEKDFQILADSNPLLIWITDAGGANLFVNKTYRDYIGVTDGEAGGFNWRSFIHPDDSAAYIEEFAQAAREQRAFHKEVRVRRADGAWRFLSCHAEPRFSSEGQFLGHMGHTMDITEHKLAELALVQSQDEIKRETNRLLAVLEALPVGVALVNRDGGVVLINQGFGEVWGSPLPQTLSTDDYGRYQAWQVDSGLPLQPEEWASARAVLRDETVKGQFLEIERFDSQRAYVMNSAAPIHDESGQIVGSAVVIMDITEKVEAEQALYESENLLRIALENSPVIVFTQDCNLRYTWLFGSGGDMDPSDLVGKRDDEIPFFSDIGDLVASKQQVIDSGEGLRKEVHLRIKERDYYFLLSLEPLLTRRGEIIGLRGSAIDVTELRRLQERQREYRSQMEIHHRLLEQREKDRQAIAREIHDGPVQTLSSSLFNIQYAREISSDPQLQTELEQVSTNLRGAIRELRQVIFDLRPPSVIRFGLTRAIRFHVDDLREKTPEIRFILRLADDRDKLPDAMHLPLFRIYQEAMANALRHSEASRVWVRYQLHENTLLLEVRDNGKGLPEDCDPNSLTLSGHFGLAGIRERVDAIDGELEIISSEGKGTTIRIKAPIPAK